MVSTINKTLNGPKDNIRGSRGSVMRLLLWLVQTAGSNSSDDGKKNLFGNKELLHFIAIISDHKWPWIIIMYLYVESEAYHLDLGDMLLVE